jgi:hypothetical protein
MLKIHKDKTSGYRELLNVYPGYDRVIDFIRADNSAPYILGCMGTGFNAPSSPRPPKLPVDSYCQQTTQANCDASLIVLEELFKGNINFVSAKNGIVAKMLVPEDPADPESNKKEVKTVMWADGDDLEPDEKHRYHIKFDSEIPSENEPLRYAALVLYALRNETEYTVLKDRCEKLLNEYSASGEKQCNADDAFFFAIDIRYGVLENMLSLDIEECQKEAFDDYVRRQSSVFEYSSSEIMDDVDDINPAVLLNDIPIKKSASAIAPVELNAEDLKAGKYRLDYNWDPEIEKYIPALSEETDAYVLTKEFMLICRKLKFRLNRILMRLDEGKTGLEAICNDIINIDMFGPPGGGKTMAAKMLASYFGLPFYSITFSEKSETDEIEGGAGIDQDGKFQMMVPNLVKFVRSGGVILLDEVNAMTANLMMLLNALLERPYRLTQNGGFADDIERHPLCVILGAHNIGTAGTFEMNEAFATRFTTKVEVNPPTEDEMLQILSTRFPSEKACKWVYDIYREILEYCNGPKGAEDLNLVLTLRACFGALDLIEEGSDPKLAIECSMVNCIRSAAGGIHAEIADRVSNKVEEFRDLRI